MGTVISTSCIHLMLSTTPFLILFSYFLYAAHERPTVLLKLQQQQQQQDDDDASVTSRSTNGDGLIPLMDMLQMALVTLVCWAWFVSYLVIFVPNRRNLMKRYKNNDQQQHQQKKKQHEQESDAQVLEVIGDVYYDRPKGILGRVMEKVLHTDLAYVTYKYPGAAAAVTRSKGQQSGVDGDVRFVEKKIRTYHPYHRENVTICVLKDYPLSGQPKSDIERDVASFQR